MTHQLRPPREVLDYYDSFPEELRLERGPYRLEFERTKEILARVHLLGVGRKPAHRMP